LNGRTSGLNAPLGFSIDHLSNLEEKPGWRKRLWEKGEVVTLDTGFF
jgi:hypothetical protein